MFREMRRSAQQLTEEECAEVLGRATSGVLALAGDDGYPYAVPVSFVFDGDRLFFHGALTGHRLDSVRRCEKASFCVIDKDEVIPEKYTTYYRSVIVFGRMRELAGEEKTRALALLAEKYSPDDPQGRMKEAETLEKRLVMLELAAGHITGKESVELRRGKQAD